MPAGYLVARDNATLAGGDGFKITVEGKGGHGAQPHTTIDPIVIGLQIVLALQTVVSRNVDPILPGVVSPSVHSMPARRRMSFPILPR